MIIFYIISGFLILLSVPMLMGKGENMIAGYNTMNHEDKEKFEQTHDIKKISRSIGILLILIALIIAILGIEPSYAKYSSIVIVVMVVFLLIYINLGCRKE